MAYEKLEENGNVFNAEAADAQMNWAMEKAGLTIGYFRECILDTPENQYGHSLKVRIQDEKGTEHLWLTDISIDEDGLYYGLVDSDPITIESVKSGSRIGVAHDAISDWLLVEDGRLIGGYTIRVYRESLTEKEQAEFDRNFGLVIDYGVDYFAHDLHTPEGAILCLEDAYASGDLEAALACKDFETEARMLLSQLPNMEGFDEDMVAQMATTLRIAFQAHMQAGGFPSFEGVEHAFPMREFSDKDTCMVTEICYHPDGRMTLDRLVVTRRGDEWRVGPPVNLEEDEDAEAN